MATKGKVVKAAVKKKVAAKVKAAPAKKTTSKKSAATPASKKQTAATKKVVSKVAVKAASKSAVKPGMKKVEVKKPVSAPVAVAVAAAPKAPVAAPAAASKKGFGVNEYVVYPTHGVGKILGIEAEKIGDYELKVFVIAFEKDKMILRVPVGRAEAAGLRAISPNDQITRAITTLKGRAKIARGMWSRRAQEYEAKINSGNLVQIAEVVRDLHKNVDQSERSYSERMIYETAMHRLCGEVAASERVDI
jgi:CarD family transcriptional regulator